MSGRAGRRGLDERGIVMLMVDEKMDSAVGKGLLKVSGRLSMPQILNAQFFRHLKTRWPSG